MSSGKNSTVINICVHLWLKPCGTILMRSMTNNQAKQANFDLDEFCQYFEKIRARTMRIIRCVPPENLEWSYREGKFSIGDLIRHIAAIERHMYAENAQFKSSRYAGHGTHLAHGYEEVLKFLEMCHSESMSIFRSLSQKDLQNKCVTPNGTPVTLWKWLRAMIEHEVHHRGQIYLYLTILEVPTPPLYGLTSEEVRNRSIQD